MRKFQAVNAEWNVEATMSDNYVAAIAYDDEQTDYTFAVYKNTNETFTNFMFRIGGHATSVKKAFAFINLTVRLPLFI